MTKRMEFGKHCTVHRDIRRCLQSLWDSGLISKVILGRPSNCRHHYTPGTLKVREDIPGGLKVNAYDGDGVRSILLFGDRARLRKHLDG